jgi:hypothetical protein
VTLDQDVAAAVQDLRRRDGIGVSESVNRLVRAGLARHLPAPPYTHTTSDLGMKIDVCNIGEVLDLLDGT